MAVTNNLCQTKIWFAFIKIGFCASTKDSEEALNAVKFFGWLKIFVSAQNILGPVKGQGICYLAAVMWHLNVSKFSKNWWHNNFWTLDPNNNKLYFSGVIFERFEKSNFSDFWGPLNLQGPSKRSNFWILDLWVCIKKLGLGSTFFKILSCIYYSTFYCRC